MKELKSNVTCGKDVVFTYIIYLTPFGKGYGCFAIKKTEDYNKFLVGASFCHPSDRNKFRKDISRNIALGRATKEFSFDEELKLDTLFVVNYLLYNYKIDYVPYWAEKSYDIGTYFHKLSNDNYNEEKFLNKICKKDKKIETNYLKWAIKLLKNKNNH